MNLLLKLFLPLLVVARKNRRASLHLLLFRFLCIVMVQSLRFIKTRKHEADNGGKDIILHEMRHIFAKLLLFYLQNLIEFRSAKPKLSIDLRCLQVCYSLMKFFLLIPTAYLLGAFISDETADRTTNQRTHHRNRNQKLTCHCPEDRTSHRRRCSQNVTSKLLHFLAIRREFICKYFVKPCTEGSSKDHIAEYWDMIHELLHRSRQYRSLREIFEEMGNASVPFHQIETSSDDSVKVCKRLERLTVD